jgi:hypothetical protein
MEELIQFICSHCGQSVSECVAILGNSRRLLPTGEEEAEFARVAIRTARAQGKHEAAPRRVRQFDV